MTIQPNDVIRVVARMERDGTEDCLNVYHVKHKGSTNVTDSGFLTAIASRLDTAYGQIEHHLTTDLEFIDIEAYNVTRDLWVGSTGWPVRTFGTSAAEELPHQVAALVTFRTATTQHPGKKFIGGYTEDSNAGDGVLGATTITALIAFVTQLLASLTIEGNAFEFGNYNYTLTRWAVWVAGAVDAIWATQRRRKPGVGS